ncbi:hypothetical protein GJAV_G00069190 [Gymnothorax javanicus]|nr:hypothetical protein GJAV_G00069190 [Gymnothorax javanicus]
MFRKLKAALGPPRVGQNPEDAAQTPTPAPPPAPAPPAAPASAQKEENPTAKTDEAKKEGDAKPGAPAPAAPAPENTKPEEKPAAPVAGAPGAGQEAPPSPPRPIVVNKYADAQMRDVIKRLRVRTEFYKEKVIDPTASSPEPSPPVNKKDEKKDEKKEEKKKEEAKEGEAAEKAPGSYLLNIGFTCLDFLLKPLEDAMDKVVGKTFDPFTDRRYIMWLSLVTLAFNYNAWLLPARFSFPYHTERSIPYWIAFDVLCDLIYVIDIIIFRPRLQFVKGGDVILDVISVIPFDLLCLKFGFSSVFRANRLLKLQIERAQCGTHSREGGNTRMTVVIFCRVIRTIGYLIFILHINACIYYIASDYEGIASTKWVYSGKGNAYLRCYYFAVRTLITIGGLPEPHTVFEIVFQLLNYFTGVFVFSSLIGQMRDVIGAATAGETYFRSSMDGTVSYMNDNKIPKLVQQRVRTWYNYTWASQGMLGKGWPLPLAKIG